MQRFYVTFPLDIDVTITDTDIYHQLTRVLRIQVWERVILFDGDGSQTEYEVTHIDKRTVSLRWQERRFPTTENKKTITLYQAMPNKLEKIEYILQKWVEVWISRFVFFRSERSQKIILSDAKKERLISIAREAVEQCGGMVIPEIEFLDRWIDFDIPWYNLTLDTIWLTRTFREFDRMRDMNLWIGPEWGWSEAERTKMLSNGFIFARFGERVLRTETVGVVTAFALLHA